MQFTTTSAITLLAFASSAAASPLAARQDALQDWQVTDLAVSVPMGRPGSYPWGTLKANITDPNAINLGTSSDGSQMIVPAGSKGVNCEAKWYINGDSPIGRAWPCDATSNGYWFMHVYEGTNGFSSSNFDLKFTRVAEKIHLDTQYKATFEAKGHFDSRGGLGGVCSAGECNWGLLQSKKPFKITPSKV
ncbi:hypothetical protein COCMIDRAFT_7318 [Bipolaris oryzae ATCC 44560]|uniref:Cell death in tomato 1 n=1 Tax=Bipolaris oryzae ATCC 44560 TaxID=930090 RepID=W6YUV5_COCMI|nr:uncharacterized protein COCMIDRAFT_7318 [Bipolaris oryzae ATCC 44560]EUC43212.1 hypothetical protein COCMIDRAFT_7318 [Bipolaris oryzae ATCC 44560]